MIYIHKDYSNRRIHLGLVASCKKNDKYGLLYGIRRSPYYGGEQIFENKLYYFEKEGELEIAQNTLVSYLSYDYDGFIPQVEYVYPVSSLVRHHRHPDARGTRREDDCYHDDETWRLINEGIPYIDIDHYLTCIYYPIIEYNECTIWRGLLEGKDSNVYWWFRYIRYSLEYPEWPTLEEIANAIVKFREQVDSINAFEIIDTYEIHKLGLFNSTPKYDYYEELLSYKLCFDDEFLSHLLPTKEEVLNFEEIYGGSSKYKGYSILLEEETKQAREKAKAEYSKEKHFAFLINDYFLEAQKRRERIEIRKKNILDEFDVEYASEIASQFQGEITDEFISLMNEYNDSTVVGLLYSKKS